MNMFKTIGVALIAGSAAALVILKDKEEKKKNAELDEFLLSDETEAVVINIPKEDVDSLEKDILSLKETPVSFVFSLENKEKAMLFQDLLSEKGISSKLNSETTVEAVYNDEINESNLSDLLEDMHSILENVDAKYDGCH